MPHPSQVSSDTGLEPYQFSHETRTLRNPIGQGLLADQPIAMKRGKAVDELLLE